MPAASRTHKAEAKYNVTTDFPHLGLHSAAATGNIGLVNYALTHGQPINSVLDGVLPIHAACSGGSEVAVELLIENGADVNAPRLPRRYSDKTHTPATIVGETGSTPLHFAAANGHIAVIRILLDNGASPDRPDKHGVTPEILARENGWIECAEVLKDASVHGNGYGASHDRDERARERKHSHGDAIDCKIKRSIDVSRHKLSPIATHHPSSSASPSSLSRSPVSPHPPSRTLTPYSSTSPLPIIVPSSNNSIGKRGPGRRPSLPHLSANTPPRASTNLKGQRRPKSAGTGADQHSHSPSPRPLASASSSATFPDRSSSSLSGAQRKLSSKYSLLNIFRKASDAPPSPPDPSSSLPSYHPPGTPTTPSAPQLETSVSSPLPLPGSSNWYRSRLGSEVNVGTSGSVHGSSPLAAVELHHVLSIEDRASAVDGVVFDDDIEDELDDKAVEREREEGQEEQNPSTSARPGLSILRTHSSGKERSSSSTSQITHASSSSSSRSLRFDDSASSSSAAFRGSSRSPARPTKGRHSSSSSFTNRPGSAGSLVGSRERERGVPELFSAPPSAIATQFDFHRERDREAEDEEDDNHRHARVGSSSPAQISRLHEMRTEIKFGRMRGQSFTSSGSSMSPNASPDVTVASTAADFPFSISKPPPTDDANNNTNTSMQHLDVPTVHSHGGDLRMRGDSLSSMDTDKSSNTNPQTGTSAASTTVTSPSGSVAAASPPIPKLTLPPSFSTRSVSSTSISPILSSTKVPFDSSINTTITHDSPTSSLDDLSFSDTGDDDTLPRVPLEIDIRAISSHAQAEALVQRAQQSILEMAEHLSDDEQDASGAGGDNVPLSAKLAAYGETLAIERRFKRGERQRMAWGLKGDSDDDEHDTFTEFGASQRSGQSSGRTLRPGLDSTRHDETAHYGAPRDRTTSLERSMTGLPPPATRAPKIRRPQSSGDSNSRGWSATPMVPRRSLGGERPLRLKHGQVRSSSAAHREQLHVPTSNASTVTTNPQTSADILEADELGYVVTGRSRTPDPVPDSKKAPPIGFSVGVPLSRVSTAPLQETQNDLVGLGLARQTSRDSNARQIASANKLAKMGLTTSDNWQPVSTTSALLPPPPPSSSSSHVKSLVGKQRLGSGLKTMLQSFRGK